mmetsp:Transcript_114752/g.365977  ORF Transcript_114752/g.365977 Transcript_114752/m.365977 type:complete len:327 (-) Transcript_114752:47-1027(-)
MDFMVRRPRFFTALCSFSLSSMLRAGFPSSRPAWSFTNASFSVTAPSTLPRMSRSTLLSRRSIWSISEKMSSKLMVSMSRSGSTDPSTCVMSSFSKQRTTCTMASTSRMLLRNLLPSPSPFEAPFTRPAMSTYSICSGMTFSDLAISASSPRRASGTVARATLGSMVQNGKFAASAFPFSHNALKSVLLPTLGSPTMPVLRPRSCVRLTAPRGWPPRRRRTAVTRTVASATALPAARHAAVWADLATAGASALGAATPASSQRGTAAPTAPSVAALLLASRRRSARVVKAGNPKSQAKAPTKQHSRARTAGRRKVLRVPAMLPLTR